MTTQWTPVLTTNAGLTLTSLNWQEANVATATYYLDELLVKPGINTLMAINDMAQYLNWSGAVVLNASRFKANKEGKITVTSPFDGSKVNIDYQQLIALIQHIRPAFVVLPRGILTHYPQLWDNWNQQILPFCSLNEIQSTSSIPVPYGVYATVEQFLVEKNAYSKHHPNYIIGAITNDLLNEFKQAEIDYWESDMPAQYGMNGIVYSDAGMIDLKQTIYELDFTAINTSCSCPTCSSGLTKAYLHHLYQHTPLLCQRFLIQHNAFFITR